MSDAPAVSVIMATYNGARFLASAIESILDQTFGDFELIVGDDCSTDATASILARIADPRLVVLRNARNLGVVATRNACLARARAPLVAMLDHDDLSRPRRLERQVDFLARHAEVVLVGTASQVLANGAVLPSQYPSLTTPALLDWLMLIQNPLVCSSVMFRRAAAASLAGFMREDFRYADDFDFYHRMRAVGRIARIDEALTLYRLHETNSFRANEALMEANAVRALMPAYAPLFGAEAERAATLVLRHLSGGKAVPDRASLATLRDVLARLVTRAGPTLDGAERKLLRAHVDRMWRRVLRASASEASVGRRGLLSERPREHRLNPADAAHVALASPGLRRWTRRLRPAAKAGGPGAASPHPETSQPGALLPGALLPRTVLHGVPCMPVPFDPADPPTLFLVVDTEAEFDWTKPFARDLDTVAAMDALERGQEVFDRHGLRPIYVVDHPVATQERGARTLRSIAARDGCEIGVHLHPWTTPPFEEELSPRNSFPGNLDPALETRKLATLVAAITAAFGRPPRFYKAGRYGLGARTAANLAHHGITVDLSVLPGADLSATGGPDYREVGTTPCLIGETGVLTIPMTRETTGWWPGCPGAGRVGLRPLLSRARISDTITLTPEGVTVAEQKRLVRARLRRGERLFVLHFHSPSLAAGCTPYAPDEAAAAALRRNLAEICGFLIDELGFMPGQPRRLIRMAAEAHRNAVGESYTVARAGAKILSLSKP